MSIRFGHVLAAVCLGVAAPPATGGELVVGHLDGLPGTNEEQAGAIVSALVGNAADALNIRIETSDVLDVRFFESIDVFVFANASGVFEYVLGAPAREHLHDFVTRQGGIAYLGIDDLADGGQIAASFGFDLGDRSCIQSDGVITDLEHPIATGPFQPASEFHESCHARFNGVPPAGGSFLGTTTYGAGLAYHGFGPGEFYAFSDEVPVASPGVAHHQAMFNNVLVAAGATLVCPADLDQSGAVDVNDLLAVLGGWGTPAGDITGDDATDVADLLSLLDAWGLCPA